MTAAQADKRIAAAWWRKLGSMAVVWSLLVGGSLAWNLKQVEDAVRATATAAAHATINKDLSFRKWGASHGGVYVPVTGHTPPNPYLHLPGQEVVTTSGLRLTLMNPAYMLRQMQEDFPGEYGARSRITSLKPINPHNAPDAWEAKALRGFARERKERAEVQEIDGKPYVRVLRPFVVVEECLKCHEQQGYNLGEVRGGIGASIPLAPFAASERERAIGLIASHGAIWLAGLLALGFWYRRDRMREAELRQTSAQHQATAHLLRLMCDNVPDMIWAKDRNGVYLFANQALCNNLLLARDTDEPIGKTDIFFALRARASHPERADWHTFGETGSNSDEAVLASRQQQRFDEYGNVRGEFLFLDVYKAPFVDEQGNLLGTVGCGRIVTREKQIEAEQEKAREQLRLSASVFDNSSEGVVVTDAEQRILMVNRAFAELTGYGAEEVLGQTPKLLRSGRHDRNFYTAMWASIHEIDHWQGEIWNRRKDGEVFPEWLSISAVKDGSGQVTHYVGVFTDISHLKESEARLDYLARHDPLTGLPNRLMLTTLLEHAFDHARREGKRLALLLLDFDRFKDVNDSFGHAVGDELLQQAAGRLTARLRSADTISRLGGDEFTVLLEELAQPQDAARVADDLIAAMNEPFTLSNGIEVRVGTSIGIALYPDHGGTEQELLQQADAALYRAKAEGRGRFKYFSEELTRGARERIALEARLRRALAQNELRVHYQPQVDIESGRITGAEALVRWQHPEEGLIPPVRFIPVAEETGLIDAIGTWVLRETCRQGKAWLDAGLAPLTLAVNVSPYQIRHGDIVATAASILAETGFPAEWLELELTESALMEREGQAVEILQRIRALGVRLALDDFGTGYSSLAYLKRFPLDVLKIDKSFVDDIPHLRDDMEIAATIVAMGHTLRFKVLAEGVETEEQLAFLTAQGCDSYQGYLKSPPVPAADFMKWLVVASQDETHGR